MTSEAFTYHCRQGSVPAGTRKAIVPPHGFKRIHSVLEGGLGHRRCGNHAGAKLTVPGIWMGFVWVSLVVKHRSKKGRAERTAAEATKTKTTPKTTLKIRTCGLPGCNRPCWVEPRTGIEHGYCGRTHAAQHYESLGKILPPPHGCCHACHLDGCSKLVFFDAKKGRVHDFCCKEHAQQAINKGLWPKSSKRTVATDTSMRCALPGCKAPRFRDPASGEVFEFCGRAHALKAKANGFLPRLLEPPKHTGEVFEVQGEGTITELLPSHEKYQDITWQFQESWKHPGTKPTVVRVLQLWNPGVVWQRHCNYTKALEARMGPGKGNVVRRFHGTSLGANCNFAVAAKVPPCDGRDCSLCSICSKSFSLDKAGSGTSKNTFSNRYGDGMYFSATSSKANDYAADSERQIGEQNVRVMLLCRVACGNTYVATKDAMSADEVKKASGLYPSKFGGPYDSLRAETTENGGALNYDEEVIFNDAAAIPSYAIVYSRP